jgi:hypothetical protein
MTGGDPAAHGVDVTFITLRICGRGHTRIWAPLADLGNTRLCLVRQAGYARPGILILYYRCAAFTGKAIIAHASGGHGSRGTVPGHGSRASRIGRNLACASASSAAGSEPATMPPPAKIRAREPAISPQRSAMPHSPLPRLSTQPTGPV